MPHHQARCAPQSELSNCREIDWLNHFVNPKGYSAL